MNEGYKFNRWITLDEEGNELSDSSILSEINPKDSDIEITFNTAFDPECEAMLSKIKVTLSMDFFLVKISSKIQKFSFPVTSNLGITVYGGSPFFKILSFKESIFSNFFIISSRTF